MIQRLIHITQRSMDKKDKKPKFLEGRVYLVDNKKYLVEAVEDSGLHRTYGFQVDENHQPYGRRRIIAVTSKTNSVLLD
jgi:hypothetical protein